MNNNSLETLYLYTIDSETGIIARYEITEYEVHDKYISHRGRSFHFKCETYARKDKNYDVFENDFDKVFHGKIVTLNPDDEYAMRVVCDWIRGRRDTAYEQAANAEALYKKILQNNKISEESK